jgi:steroid delta-isomerase-like uncharacterized protein
MLLEGGDMTHDVRALAARWFDEVWNQRREAVVDEMMAPEAVGHMEGAEVRGRAEFKAVRDALLGAFPDLRIVVEGVVADGDDAVVRWRVTATHTGAELGFPASHRPAAFRGLTWLRFRDGKIVEGWDAWNQGALMQALGGAAAGTAATP